MNKKKMYDYAKSNGSILSDETLRQKINTLENTLPEWKIVKDDCFHIITNKQMYLFYNNIEQKFIDINFENVIKINNRYILENEILYSHLGENITSSNEYFSLDELNRIEKVTNKYKTYFLLDYSSGKKDSVAEKIYNEISILKDGEDDDSMTIGFELETNVIDGRPKIQVGDYVSHIIDTRIGHAERDSTITGIEFDSHVFTWNKLKKIKPLVEKMLLKIADSGLEATAGSGLHIHIGRDAFVSQEAFFRFFLIINAQSNRLFWQKLARRKVNNYCVFIDTPLDIDRLIKTIKRNEYSHGVAVNQQHSSTYEVRIFASTLSVDVLYASIELMVNLVNFCNELELKTFDKDNINSGEYVSKYLNRIINIQPLQLSFLSKSD